MDTEIARTVTRLLELVVAGEIEPAQALARWPQTADGEPAFGTAWHDLAHFAADGDIRKKDEQYADYQVGLLKKRIAEVREAYGLTSS